MTDDRSGPETRSKVTRLIGKYGLDGMGDDLERMWQGDDVERHSLRDLATYFNRRIVEAALRDAGANPIDGEVENTYRLLTDDETTSGTQTRIERRLERDGINVEELRTDFVSHQAIHTYLTDVREAEHEKQAGDPVERGIETVQRLQGRVTTVSETTIDDLSNTGHVSVGDFDVIANVRVVCRDCGSQYDVTELLRRGHCDCEE